MAIEEKVIQTVDPKVATRMQERAERLVDTILKTTTDRGLKEAKYRLISSVRRQLIESWLEGYEEHV